MQILEVQKIFTVEGFVHWESQGKDQTSPSPPQCATDLATKLPPLMEAGCANSTKTITTGLFTETS